MDGLGLRDTGYLSSGRDLSPPRLSVADQPPPVPDDELSARALSGMSPANVRREIRDLEQQIHKLLTARSRRRTAEGLGLSRYNNLVDADNSPYKQGVAFVGLSDDAEFVGDSSCSGKDVPVSHVTVRRGKSGGAQNFWGASHGTDISPTGLGEGQLQPRVGNNVSAPANAKPKAEPKSKFRRVQPTIKLCSYDGSTPLESHIAKLNNCTKHYS